MTRWKTLYAIAPMKKFCRIFCFTCNTDVPNKKFLKVHRGHDVQYVKEDGTIDE